MGGQNLAAHVSFKTGIRVDLSMNNPARKTLPLALIIPIANGSDPDVIEIEDCTEVYGDNVEQLYPEVDTPCEHPDAPCGQCHFNAVGLEPTRCKYCGKLTG